MVEEIYRLVWTAIRRKQPIEATYQRRMRLLCRIGLAAILTDNCVWSVTSMVATARADWSRRARLPIGVG
jgi:hypothetical protein